MTGAALGVATAFTLLVQGMPSTQTPTASAASSPRVWAHVTFAPVTIVPAPRFGPKPECRMPVLKGDVAVDPKFVLTLPPGTPRHRMRIVGGEPPLDCPSR